MPEESETINLGYEVTDASQKNSPLPVRRGGTFADTLDASIGASYSTMEALDSIVL